MITMSTLFFSTYSTIESGANDDFKMACLIGMDNPLTSDSIFCNSFSMSFSSSSNFSSLLFLKKDRPDWFSMHVIRVIWASSFFASSIADFRHPVWHLQLRCRVLKWTQT